VNPGGDPLGQADSIVVLARQLAATLRAGTATIADGRELERTIREAQGWLVSARNFLDPEWPAEDAS